MSEQRDSSAGDAAGGAGPGPAVTVPPGSTEVRQSSWAWLWGAVPWIALAALFASMDLRSGLFIFAVALGVAVTIPRYLMWRRTVYHVAHDGVVFQRGLIGTPQMYHLPAQSFQRIVSRPGVFGNLLGYHAVDIRMREGGRVSLSYVPAAAGMIDRLTALRDRHSDYDEEREQLEMAIIEARQRGEEIPPEYMQEADGGHEAHAPAPAAGPDAPDAPEVPEVPEAAERDRAEGARGTTDPGPVPERPPARPASGGARQYRPEVSGYDPGLRRPGERGERDR